MSIRNIDLSDSLVNGVIDTVTDFNQRYRTRGNKFDNSIVDQKKRRKMHISSDWSTPIQSKPLLPLQNSKVETIKSPCPLTLTFAFTIHKTKRKTTEKIVFSLDGPNRPGHALFVLSRSKRHEWIEFYKCTTINEKIKNSNVYDWIYNFRRFRCLYFFWKFLIFTNDHWNVI